MSEEKSGGWFGRLKDGLSKSSQKLADGITDLFTKRKLDAGALQDLEEILITGDMGVTTAAKLAGSLAERRFEADISPDVVRAALAEDIADILAPVAKPLEINPAHAPHVVLVCGVNGSGKTTTIGKMAKQFKQGGHTVMIAAGDTFRAAAVEQLQIWGERSGCPVITGTPGGDAAALAYTALEQAKAERADVLMI
ncbi:MAG: signal recognition particle-docking protein FtsY, partial [Rhodospirillaceae bacterium]|nr:signal recognition particle-docking protein FtsY [Rhodospirillaceae bacterium]